MSQPPFAASSLAAQIDRHLALGLRFSHAPVTADALPPVRDYLARTRALIAQAGAAGHAARTGRLRSVEAALDARLRAALRG